MLNLYNILSGIFPGHSVELEDDCITVYLDNEYAYDALNSILTPEGEFIFNAPENLRVDVIHSNGDEIQESLVFYVSESTRITLNALRIIEAEQLTVTEMPNYTVIFNDTHCGIFPATAPIEYPSVYLPIEVLNHLHEPK